MTQPTGLDIGVDLELLARCYANTGEVLDAIPADRWNAPSPCSEWTVREVAEHLVEALDYFGATVSGAQPSRERPTYDEVTARCLAAFGDPAALAVEHPFGDGALPGRAIATISLSETLVHGWDLATGAGLPYAPDPAAVTTLATFADGPKTPGLFADPVPAPADAPPFVVLLARLGRAA